MRTVSRLAIIASVLVVSFPVLRVRADVYRCVQSDGPVSYQQIPCNSHSRPMELRDQRSGWSALRPGERALLDRYRRKYAAHSRKSGARKSRPDRDDRACWSHRKKLEEVRTRLRRGYRLKEGEGLRRKRHNHEDYLRKFCS
jgi:hypothetical protein